MSYKDNANAKNIRIVKRGDTYDVEWSIATGEEGVESCCTHAKADEIAELLSTQGTF